MKQYRCDHFVSCHLTKMVTMPIYGKTLKSVLLLNQKANDIGSWYVALGRLVFVCIIGDIGPYTILC